MFWKMQLKISFLSFIFNIFFSWNRYWELELRIKLIENQSNTWIDYCRFHEANVRLQRKEISKFSSQLSVHLICVSSWWLFLTHTFVVTHSKVTTTFEPPTQISLSLSLLFLICLCCLEFAYSRSVSVW